MGRPPIEIDQPSFEKLCGLMATLVEIAGFFDCSVDTIERWCKATYEVTFAEVYRQKAGKGKISLRRKQYEIAMTGNVTMLIWLGKQYLGQSDKMEQKIDAEVASTIKKSDLLDRLKQIKGED